ncbi:hypothetical protein [Brevibacillus dissolubilis]|uniref:hypothetical protein n=1 Tax=Brevibacillus dissolubilis TaxID=1844116 RepID=UPI00159B8DA8|nr:hypothetical protein [Brevibacillus dissolubilis]
MMKQSNGKKGLLHVVLGGFLALSLLAPAPTFAAGDEEVSTSVSNGPTVSTDELPSEF